MNPNKPNHSLFQLRGPWEESLNPVWLGSTISLTRNMDKFNFPGKLTLDKQQQVLSLLKKSFSKNNLLKNPKIIGAEELSAIEKEFLVEHFLSSESFHQTQTGQAFVIDDTGKFLAMINLKDHIVLQMIEPKEELETSWDLLVKIENTLTQSTDFAFSPKFGFLTSDPNQCGTGLVVNIFLHLPALCVTGQLNESLKKIEAEGIVQTGLQGSPDQMIGDVIVFHNLYTLGVTEEHTLSLMRTLATKLSTEERVLRQDLKVQNTHEIAEIKNKVSRAFGILLHSYQIEAVEALQALSLVKLGLDLGWIKGTVQSHLNSLFFSCRRAHLTCELNQPVNQDEILHRRSEFIHKALQGLELLI